MKQSSPCHEKTDHHIIMHSIRTLLLTASIICISIFANAQTQDTSKLLVPIVRDSSNNVSEFLTLKQCIDYAMQHQPALNESLLNIEVAKTTNAINLSTLLPQVSANGTLTHYIQQNSAENSIATSTGTSTSTTYTTINNTFIPQLVISQTLFNPSLLYAAKSAPLYTKQAEQVTDSTKIYLVSAVSKSFYNLLLTLEQINVLKEDTARLGRNVRDTYHQYVGGIVDETDYEEATITLNNSMASLKQANENITPQYAQLKQLMGYPPEKQFNVNFDTLQMMQEIHVDTTEQLQYEKRIEFQQLNTQKALQMELVNYYRTSFLPTVSAFYNYDLGFESNKFSELFDRTYPSQIIGASLSIPIFTGFYRTNNLKKARLQEKILDWSGIDLKSQIYTEYATALANYKGNFYNLQLLQKNVALARRTYFVVTLQYKQGIVAYLNVITAESNLISSEISYLNALFQVLSNKIDLEKAMGDIKY
jgi:multidrug efflux system outer membrane protein